MNPVTSSSKYATSGSSCCVDLADEESCCACDPSSYAINETGYS